MKHGTILSTADTTGPPAAISVTPGATISIDVSTGNYAKWTAGEAETVNATGTQFAGQELTLIIVNDGLLPRTVTFGTGFKPVATIVGTASKVSIIKFVSDGTNLYELARTLVLG